MSKNDLQHSALLIQSRVIFFLTAVILLHFGCAAAPKIKQQGTKTVGELERDTADEMVGPPSLLALSEGAVEAEFEEESAERLTPRLKMLKKTGRSLTVIELWLKAGISYELNEERGASEVFAELIENHLNHGEGEENLRSIGAQVMTTITFDRLIIHIEVESSLCFKALKSLSKSLKLAREGIHVESVLEHVKNQTRSPTWIEQRLSSRLIIENLNRLPQNRLESLSSPLFDIEDFKSLSHGSMTRFIRDTAQSSKAELLIVGDFNTTEIRNAVSSLFVSNEQERAAAKGAQGERESRRSGDSKGSRDTEGARINDPLKEGGEKKLSVDIEPLDTQLSSIEIAIPLSELSPEEAGYLDLLGFVLVGDKNGRIHQEAERTGLELHSSSARTIVTDRGSVFLVKMTVPANQVKEGWRFLLVQLSALIHQPISQRTLERAKSIFERETLLIGESLLGQARRLGHFSTHWPMKEALKRYGRAVYRARPITLLKFIQNHFQRPSPSALIAGPVPMDSEPTMWKERLSEQLDEAMTQRSETPLLGFSRHGDQLSLLLVPSESEGVSSMVVTLPIKPLEDVVRYKRSTHMALAHWFAALVSSNIPNEPHIEALFDDRSLILYATFPSRQIGEVFTTLMRRLRQAPLRSESQWQSNALEQARLRAMSQLSLLHQSPQEKLNYLTTRAQSAFTKTSYPLPKERRELLAALSSSELSRWFRQHIQSEPMYAVITGDVEEVQLGRSLSPLTSQKMTTRAEPTLHNSPIKRMTNTEISRCRSVKLIADNDEAWVALSYPIPTSVNDVDLRLLESAIVERSRGSDFGSLRTQIVRAHHTKPHSFTLHLNAPAHLFNDRWPLVKQLISELSERPVSTERLELLKLSTMRLRAQEVSKTRTYAELHSEAWFRGWQSEGGLKESSWRASIKAYRPDRLQEVAREVFKDQQLILSMILPPYIELSPTMDCQVVTP